MGLLVPPCSSPQISVSSSHELVVGEAQQLEDLHDDIELRHRRAVQVVEESVLLDCGEVRGDRGHGTVLRFNLDA